MPRAPIRDSNDLESLSGVRKAAILLLAMPQDIAELRAHDATWGLRRVDDVARTAGAAGLDLAEVLLVSLVVLGLEVRRAASHIVQRQIIFVDLALAQVLGLEVDKGVKVDDEYLATEIIHQVGPGGNFLDQEHTARHCREFYTPATFYRGARQAWMASSAALKASPAFFVPRITASKAPW